MSSRKRTILVTDTSRGSAVSIIRSLGRRGWRVIATDSDPNSLGFLSRYVAGAATYPSPSQHPARFVQQLLRIVQEHHVDLVIPVTEEVILPLSEARDQFDGACHLALPDANSLEVTRDKLKTVQLAEQLGVPAPQTRMVHTVAEACEGIMTVRWPVVLKPQKSRVYRDRTAIETYRVGYANSLQDLVEQMSVFENRCPVLLQQYTRGTGHGVELLMREGRPLAAFQHRRIREIPITGGASSFRQSVPLDPQLYDYSVRLLGALRWTGVAMVEYKVGRDGVWLMEINGRVWGSLPLAIHSGMDFAHKLATMYLDASGPNGAPDTHYEVGVWCRNLELDLMWIASVLAGRRRYPFLDTPSRATAVRALLGLVNPRFRFDIICLDDPIPGLAEIPKILRKFRGKLRTGA